MIQRAAQRLLVLQLRHIAVRDVPTLILWLPLLLFLQRQVSAGTAAAPHPHSVFFVGVASPFLPFIPVVVGIPELYIPSPTNIRRHNNLTNKRRVARRQGNIEIAQGQLRHLPAVKTASKTSGGSYATRLGIFKRYR